MYFSNMASVASDSRVSRLAAWKPEDRRLTRRFEIGNVLHGHDGPLVDQPGEPGGVNTSGARVVDSQPSRVFETIQQRDDVGGCGRLRIIPQPSESGAAQLRIDRQQARECIPLGFGQSGRERVEGFLSRANPCGQSNSFQHPGRGKQDAIRPEMVEHRLDDGFAAIRGPCRVRPYSETGPPVGQCETSQAQVSLQLDRMFAAGLIPLRVIGEGGGWHTELIGHEGDHRLRRLLGRSHAEAGIPEEAQLDGESEPVDRSPLRPDQRQVFLAEHVMAHHLDGVISNCEQSRSLLGRQQGARGHVGLRLTAGVRS
jgi:hypothetical protein